MYHKVGKGKHSTPWPTLKQHLTYIAENYPVVLPGDRLLSKKLSVCISFDDAYFDFYHYIFPLLQELKIRALLAVPTKYIIDSTSIPHQTRLEVPYYKAMTENTYSEKAPFCTWQELKEMSSSGLVELASHTHSHINLAEVAPEKEFSLSKKIIEEKTQQPVSTIVYPFGRVNKTAIKLAEKHYMFGIRIGSALNDDWNDRPYSLCRIIADNLPSPIFPFKTLYKFRLKTMLKNIRPRYF